MMRCAPKRAAHLSCPATSSLRDAPKTADQRPQYHKACRSDGVWCVWWQNGWVWCSRGGGGGFASNTHNVPTNQRKLQQSANCQMHRLVKRINKPVRTMPFSARRLFPPSAQHPPSLAPSPTSLRSFAFTFPEVLGVPETPTRPLSPPHASPLPPLPLPQNPTPPNPSTPPPGTPPNTLLVCQEHPLHAPELCYALRKHGVEPRAVDHDISLGTHDQPRCTSCMSMWTWMDGGGAVALVNGDDGG